MRMTFDPDANAAYFYIEDEISPGAAIENVVVERASKGDIVLDFDANGYLLGVEIIGATGLLHGPVLSKAERL
jgi:uncharacterized protein YuzE